MIDEINTVYWDFAKKERDVIEGRGSDEAAKKLFMGMPEKSKIFLDNQNGFFKHGAAYEPNFIVQGKGGEAGSVKLSHYDLLTDMVRSDELVLLPLNTFTSLWETLTPDMKFVIRKILQISELSVRHGPYVETGAKVEVQGQLKPKKQREHSATYVQEMFVINLKRFYSATVDKDGKEVEYAGVGTRTTGTGEAKFSRRLKYLNQSDYTLEVFKKIKRDEYREEFEKVAGYVNSLSDTGIFQFKGTRGGKRRKTRRRKRKTKRRKKTRRRKRTKKRKRKKNKRRKTKRRRRK